MTKIVNRLKFVNWQHFVVITLIAVVAMSFDSCKSSGKLTNKEKKAQIEMYKKKMKEIINGTTTLSLEDQEALIAEAINKNFGDEKLNDLILKAKQVTKKAYAAFEKDNQAKVAAARNKLFDLLVNKQNLSADQLEDEMNKIKALNLGNTEIDELLERLEKKIGEMRGYNTMEMKLKDKIESIFQSIVDASKAGNTSMANSRIDAVLNYFSAPDVPVLIIISREGSIVDYDKPTTIQDYLNFLKDQKENRNNLDSYELDDAGKIKVLDLIKK